MAQKFPRDRFDSIPHGIERIGAHRAPARRGSGWVAFGWAALASIVLISAGVIGIMVTSGRLDFADEPVTTPSETPVSTVPATISADLPVTVLNGTSVEGLALGATETLTAAGIPVAATANASENDLTETYVYYALPEQEGAARGVAGALPEADVRLDPAFAEIGTPFVVVLGTDYAEAIGG